MKKEIPTTGLVRLWVVATVITIPLGIASALILLIPPFQEVVISLLSDLIIRL